MKLLAFKYSRHGWHLDLAQFSNQILLVGQNASGKSNTVKALAKVAALISQKDTFTATEAMYVVLAFMIDDSKGLVYHFTVADGVVTKEELTYSELDAGTERIIINRDKDNCVLQGESINPPINKLVLNVRRDTQLYPEMEMLQKWAENVVGFSFNEAELDGDNKSKAWFNDNRVRLTDIVDDMEKTPGAKEEFFDKMKEVGYEITNIRAFNLGAQKKVLITEKGLKTPVLDVTMSKGMFRTLYLIAYLLYFKRNKVGQPAMLLIDDLCEGLDYERSTKLGKLCFGMCEELGIQLMASSNDSFLMDVVDLKYWNILRREGSRVAVINAAGAPELFNHFEMTGLNNFDLFSSDFIARYKDKLSKK